ncbi:hypothetical protein Pmar_PMAR005175 [Perkinsus marinus ATCC 50983]|uniref:Uncharacterized protein n=1 Tax=Perkinsus marinus (strain ATCC 50983 / TXsc) TaxID=423536 RepID=C5KAU4_PERM5|nr:hypothetical protein Pmar_PMAR005175 [Perkinsus marinus ATCC 50983]EER18270.1 hypothetical protein Pmar_PMAR005175 [Perkinsus marinus ATCC 50983]|eukprot:XP_002786474.1 hypothetical protein Pmar_PMAR005175 [Perkinsus marinus ATCC 50983]
MDAAKTDYQLPAVGHALDGLAHPEHRLRRLSSSGWIPTPAGTPFASAVPRSMSSVTCFEPSFIFDSCDFDAIPEDVEADLIGETPTASEGEDDDLPSRGNHLQLLSFILMLLFPHLHLA